MKYNKITLATLLIATIFTFSQCKKNKDEEPQLPPETTVGAMTFGCKVDGKVFVPKDGSGRPGLFCQYVNLGTGPAGGWFLNIPAVDLQARPNIGVSIVTDSLLIQQGVVYPFKTTKGTVQAFYYRGIDFKKLDNDPGELRVTKFDQVNRIISGTFFFTSTNISSNEKINITDGRFDIRY